MWHSGPSPSLPCFGQDAACQLLWPIKIAAENPNLLTLRFHLNPWTGNLDELPSPPVLVILCHPISDTPAEF